MFADQISIAIFIIGIISSVLIISCWIPQVMKIYKSKSTVSISLLFQLILFVGTSFWIIYGVLLFFQSGEMTDKIAAATPILLTNVIVLCFNIFITMIKLNNMKKAKKHNMSEQEYDYYKLAETQNQ